MGFPEKWIGWIKTCISTASSSVLLNGAPSTFFHATRGVRQGDPLSPMLFLLGMEVLSILLNKAKERGWITGFRVCAESEKERVTHLLFADDTIVFCGRRKTEMMYLKGILMLFEAITGLKVNLQKSTVVAIGQNMEAADYAELLGCKASALPMTYLGLPLGARKMEQTIWTGVLERVRRKLAGWKTRLLSKGGRLTLLKCVLANIPIYTMSLFKMPAKVARLLEKSQRDFLWGSEVGKRKVHLVKWAKIKRPCQEGGLGIRSLAIFNKALLGKWLWRFASEKKVLWRRVVAIKYGVKERGKRTNKTTGSAGSSLWKDIMYEWKSMTHELEMEVGNGATTAFWKDTWIGKETLVKLYPAVFEMAKNKDMSVKDARMGSQEERVWDIQLKRNLNEQEFTEWLSLQKLLYEWKGGEEGEDKVRWKRAKNGVFTVKDNFLRLEESLKRGTEEDVPWKGIWKTGCPTKVAFFTWEAVLNKILTMDNLMKRGFSLANRCYLCKNEEESSSHLLLHCDWARHLWNAAMAIMGVQWVRAQHVKEELWAWQSIGQNRLKKRLIRKVPLLIWWILWNERNRRIFMGKETTLGILGGRWLNTLQFWERGKQVDSISCIFEVL